MASIIVQHLYVKEILGSRICCVDFMRNTCLHTYVKQTSKHSNTYIYTHTYIHTTCAYVACRIKIKFHSWSLSQLLCILKHLLFYRVCSNCRLHSWRSVTFLCTRYSGRKSVSCDPFAHLQDDMFCMPIVADCVRGFATLRCQIHPGLSTT